MRPLQTTVNVSKSVLETLDEDAFWTAQLKNPPVDGEANKELITLI